jgi:hypothetical protein
VLLPRVQPITSGRAWTGFMQLIPAHYVNCHSNTVVPLWRSGNLSVVGSGSVLGLICGFECWVYVGSKGCVAVNIQQAGHAAFHGIQPCILHTQCSVRIDTELFWTLHTTFGRHILSGCMHASVRPTTPYFAVLLASDQREGSVDSCQLLWRDVCRCIMRTSFRAVGLFL